MIVAEIAAAAADRVMAGAGEEGRVPEVQDRVQAEGRKEADSARNNAGRAVIAGRAGVSTAGVGHNVPRRRELSRCLS